MSLTTATPVLLAIDTSCDDTAAAVVSGHVVLSNIVASQAQLHKPFGGVFPTVARTAHQENWPRVVALALKRAQLTWSDLDGIAVTIGPGLAPALEVGITAAKTLAAEHHLPLIPVNHVEAHAWSVLAVAKPKNQTPAEVIKTTAPPQPKFPVLAVIVSGGHTQFVRIEGLGQYTILGKTLDDAAGECLDKVGRMLNLGYPAGPVVETFAKLGDPKKFPFPLPMTTSTDFNLSYSGLKTHARNLIAKLETENSINQQTTYDLAASLQHGVFAHLSYKLTKLLQKNQDFKAVWLGGGVAANQALRATLRQTLKPFNLTLRVPYTKRLCGDNAAMIGVLGALHVADGGAVPNPATLERQPRLSLVKN